MTPAPDLHAPFGASRRVLTPSPPSVRWILFLAATLVLVSGLGQNIARALAALAGRHWDHGIHAWWMAPAGESLVYVGLLFLLGAGMVTVPRARSKRVAATVLLFPAAFTATLLVPQLHRWAGLALAVGIAVQGGALIARYGDP